MKRLMRILNNLRRVCVGLRHSLVEGTRCSRRLARFARALAGVCIAVQVLIAIVR